MIGSTLGPYQVLSKLGEGGMGEVYRARDSKLKRDVAIKVLPEAFARDPERLARFEREAEVLATLNHPNIAAVYGFQESPAGNAIVLELVDGPTLADRIAGGAMPIADALPIARQIADALEAAHERGIVHRDLKPANIKLTADGQVKVLDFGLAKMLEGDINEPRELNVTASPTMLSPAMTGLGMILGTAAYMSPEQAAARPVDKRADIWSYGVILWEMLTGQRLFDAETVSHTLADVLRAPIDLAKLPASTPPSIRDLVGRCLERDVKSRLRDIGEARVAVDQVLSGKAPASTVPGLPRPSRAALVASAVAAVAIATAGGLAFVHFRDQPAAPLVRFQIPQLEKAVLDTGMAVSPDGQKLVFVGSAPQGGSMLWLRDFDNLVARPLPGTEGGIRAPFWSPDSRTLAFGVDVPSGALKKIDIASGTVQTICRFTGAYRGGAWSRDGIIVFGTGNVGLMKVTQAGGDPVPVTTVDSTRQETQHVLPAFLPDGRRFLYFRAARTLDSMGVYVGSVEKTPSQQDLTRVVMATSGAAYIEDPNTGGGWLLFLRQTSLFAQAVDARPAPIGDLRLMADEIGVTGNRGWFSASSGVLTYRTGVDAAQTTELNWVDRQGTLKGRLGIGGDFNGAGVQLSPDGKRVAITLADPQLRSRGLSTTAAGRTWVADTSRGIFSRLNVDDGTESASVFTPDGRVIFSSTLQGAVGDIYWMSASGIGKPEPLLVKSPTVKHPNSVSPDGRFLVFDDHSTSLQQDLWVLPLDGPAGAVRTPIPFVVTAADETASQFSPDGRWIAYSSDESGRREVFVQGFAPDRKPATAVGKWQISTAGGDKPRWRHDGKELYYLGPGGKMMAVPVRSGPASFEPGLAVPLFDTRLGGFYPYDVGDDGRFLLQSIVGGALNASPITVVLNWQAALKK